MPSKFRLRGDPHEQSSSTGSGSQFAGSAAANCTTSQSAASLNNYERNPARQSHHQSPGPAGAGKQGQTGRGRRRRSRRRQAL